MAFLKKNYILFLIIILGIFLRINYDTFIPGFNYDEYAIISLAKLNPFKMYCALAIEDYHAPLYYFLIHPFTKLPNCEIIIRLLNTVVSVFNIYIFYKIGKISLNKKVGYILALLFAVNHLQISVTNFIKFYCFNIFLVSLMSYYLIRFFKENKNLKMLTIVNFLINLSFTFGFAFVFFEYLILYLNKRNKKIIKSFLISLIGFLIYLPILIIQIKSATTNIISAHGTHPSLSFFAFYIYLNDYFTPLTNYSCNIDTVESMPLLINGIKTIIENKPIDIISLISFTILSLIPTAISVFGIYKAIQNDKNNIKLLLISGLYLLFFMILIALEITGFIPIYGYQSGIILLILSVLGLCTIKNKTKYLLIGYLVVAQLIVTNVYPIEKRTMREKFYGNIDNYIEQINNKTPIIVIDAGRFTKHYYKHKNIFTFDYEEFQGSHSRKFIELIYGEEIAKKANKKNIKNYVEKAILENKSVKNITEYLEENLFNQVKKGETIVLIYNSNGYPLIYDDETIKNNLKLNYNYHLTNSTIKYQIKEADKPKLDQDSIGEIIQSHSTKIVVKEIEKKFKPVKLEQFIVDKNGKYIKGFEANNQNLKITELMSQTLAGWIFVTYQKQ